jgi:hypothetical protein
MVEVGAAQWLPIVFVAFCVGVWLGWHYAPHSAPEAEGDPESAVPVPPASGAALDAAVAALRGEIQAAAKRSPGARWEPWRVEFLSGSGKRLLGRETRQDRRTPSMVYRGMDGLTGSFVCDHQKADGTWVYRRVSVER